MCWCGICLCVGHAGSLILLILIGLKRGGITRLDLHDTWKIKRKRCGYGQGITLTSGTGGKRHKC